MVSRCTRSTKSTGPTSEYFMQQLSIVAAVLLGATLDQVIAAEWAGEGNSTYMGRAHYWMNIKQLNGKERGKEREGASARMG